MVIASEKQTDRSLSKLLDDFLLPMNVLTFMPTRRDENIFLKVHNTMVEEFGELR